MNLSGFIERLHGLAGYRVARAVRREEIYGPHKAELIPTALRRVQRDFATATATANARIAKARGDAEAIQVEAAAIRTNPEIVKLRAVEKWDGQLPRYAGGGPLPFIDVK